MGSGNSMAAHQTPRSLLEQDHLLLTARAYRLNKPSTKGELFYEGWRDPRECGGDEDRLVRSVLGEPFRSVTYDDLDVRDAVAG